MTCCYALRRCPGPAAESHLPKFLDLFLDASAVLNQSALLLLATIAGAVGAMLCGNKLYWRLWGKRVSGTVVGVRAVGRLYYPVYRYTSASGRRLQATADVGTGANPKLVTGRKVRLRVFKEHPDRVAEAGAEVPEIVGWSLLVVASAAVGIALALWPITPITWVVLGVGCFCVVYRLWRSMPAQGERPFTSVTREPPPEGLLDLPVRPIEEILSGPVRAERQRQQRIAGLIVTPILVLVGAGVFALGAHLGRTTYLLQSEGEHARGTVLFCELKKTLHGSSYYPVVQFATPTGAAVQFRDSMGSNPPAYREGEPVDVVYFAGSAQSSASIDRGLLNWIAPGALCSGGFFLALIAVGARLGAPRHSFDKCP